MKSIGRRVLSLANVVRLRILAISGKSPNNIDGIENLLPDGCIQSLAGVKRYGIVAISCDICSNIGSIGDIVPDGSVRSLAMDA